MSTLSSTLGEWHIFGCACLKHKCQVTKLPQVTMLIRGQVYLGPFKSNLVTWSFHFDKGPPFLIIPNYQISFEAINFFFT